MADAAQIPEGGATNFTDEEIKWFMDEKHKICVEATVKFYTFAVKQYDMRNKWFLPAQENYKQMIVKLGDMQRSIDDYMMLFATVVGEQ